MTFYNNILIKFGIPIDDSIGGTKITVIDFIGILIEGHRGVFSYSEEQILVNTKKDKIIIDGKNLILIEINIDEIFIKGKIDSVTRQL